MARFIEALEKEAGLAGKLKREFSEVAAALFISCADADDANSYRYEVALKRNLTRKERAEFPCAHEGIPVVPYFGEPPSCQERGALTAMMHIKRG